MISRYDPLRESLSLRRAIDQLFEQSFVQPNMLSISQGSLALMNVYQTEQSYMVQVALPGVRPEDMDVTVHNNTLTIRGSYRSSMDEETGQAQGTVNQQGQQGQMRGTQQSAGMQPQQGTTMQQQGQSQRGNWIIREFGMGSFERSVTLGHPIDLDHIDVRYENGILTLNLPISQASRPHRINVRSGQEQKIAVGAGQSGQERR